MSDLGPGSASDTPEASDELRPESAEEEYSSPWWRLHRTNHASGRRSFNRKRWRQLLKPWLAPAVIVAVLTLAATVIFGVRNWTVPGTGTAPTSSLDTAAPAGSNSDQLASGSGSVRESAPTPGTCLESAGDPESDVACDIPHAAEIIGTGDDCSMEAATRYLGGNPDVDVLHRAVEVNDVDGTCVLSAGDQQVAVSFADALELNDAVALRECLNDRTSEFVPCSQDHTGEVVARVAADATQPLDCAQQATTYMDRSPSTLFDEFTVDEVTTDSARRCVVSVRADNRWLDTSLRAVGSSKPETRPIT